MSSDTFGLELCFKTVVDAVIRKDDVLVVIVHWFLTKFGFRCIGTGDNVSCTVIIEFLLIVNYCQ